MTPAVKTVISIILSAALCAGGYFGTRQILTGGDTAAPRDNTRYTPVHFEWRDRGNGDGENSRFLAGKYVRNDGNAVLYIDYLGPGDYFAFELFARARTADESSFGQYGEAVISGGTAFYDGWIFFENIREGVVEIEAWGSASSAPASGTYYIVRAKYVETPAPEIEDDISRNGGRKQ